MRCMLGRYIHDVQICARHAFEGLKMYTRMYNEHLMAHKKAAQRRQVLLGGETGYFFLAVLPAFLNALFLGEHSSIIFIA